MLALLDGVEGGAGPGVLVGSLAALGAAALWAFGSFLFSRAMAPVPGRAALTPAAANLFKNTSAALLFGAIWWGMGHAGPTGTAWISLGISGLLGFAVGDALYFAAFSRCGVQLAALAANLIPPLAALIDFVWFGRALSGLGFVSMGVTLAGIALVVSERPRGRVGEPARDPKQRRIGIAFASLAAAAQAVAIVTGRAGFEGTELLPGTVARLAGGVLGALVIAVAFGVWQRGVRRRGPGPADELRLLARPFVLPALVAALLPACLIGAWVNLPLHSLALGSLAPGVSGVLFATTPLFALPIGMVLGERYGWRTALGTAIAFLGVVGVIRFT